MGLSAILSRERVSGGVTREYSCCFLADSETEGSKEQCCECNHTAAPHHMVERHLRSAFDPAFGIANVNGVQNKEGPGGVSCEQTNEGMAPPLRPESDAGGEEVKKQAKAGYAQEVTVVRRWAGELESGGYESDDG